MKSRLLIIHIFCFLLISCENDQPLLDPVPKITLIEVAPLTLVQFTDSLGILIWYEDGDGDLGYANPDSFSLSVLDTRLSQPDYYYVPPLTPDQIPLPIQGETRIVIRNTFLLGNGETETTRYHIKIKDRAGNWSNTVITPAITITK